MRVTMYLLRPQAKLAKEILRKHHRFHERSLRRAEEGTAWRLFVHLGAEKDVRWLDHIRPLLAETDDQASIRSRSAGAVLLVQAHGRIFAITFGTGFHAVDPSLVEPDFGLKVAANSIDPERVTLADARGLGKGRRNATSRLPTPNETFALGLLTDEEWIRKFGGEARIEGFAKSVAGADSLQLNIEDFHLFDLADKLRQALDRYQAEDYLKSFPFLDYFRRETNKETVLQLDGLIAEDMRKRDTDVGFALPDEFGISADWYKLSRWRTDRWLPELLTEDVYCAIDAIDGWKDPLRQVKVEAYDMSENVVSEKEPLRSYIVGSASMEVDGHSRDYALTAGAWFRVDQEYVDIVQRYLKDNVEDLTEGAATDWTIVFAVSTSKPGDLKKIMYFFARAALKMHGESIKGRGFRIAIAKIHKVPSEKV